MAVSRVVTCTRNSTDCISYARTVVIRHTSLYTLAYVDGCLVLARLTCGILVKALPKGPIIVQESRKDYWLADSPAGRWPPDHEPQNQVRVRPAPRQKSFSDQDTMYTKKMQYNSK